MGGLQAALAIGEEQFRVAVELPELAQGGERRRGQRYQPIAVAFGIADVHPLALGINVAHRERQPFAQA